MNKQFIKIKSKHGNHIVRRKDIVSLHDTIAGTEIILYDGTDYRTIFSPTKAKKISKKL